MNLNIIKKAAALGLTMGIIMSFAACTAKTEHKENTETSETLRAKVEAGDEATEETTSEETTAATTAETTEETTTAAPAEYTGEEYQPFINDVIKHIQENDRTYKGSDTVKVTGSMDLSGRKGISYIFTDVDLDGKHELFIGSEGTDATGNKFISVDAFVAIDKDGSYNILLSGWERMHPVYVGNGHFSVGTSLAANCMMSTLYRFNGSTCSLDVVAQYIIDSTEEPDELPVMYYTLYEGRESDFNGPAINDPADDVLHGDEATARWEEINANAAPGGIELLGSDWIRIDI